MNKRVLIPVIVLAVVVLGIAVWAMNRPVGTDTTAKAPETTTQETPKTNTKVDTGSNDTVAGPTVITYTNDGFAKASYTVRSGQPVKVVNASSGDLMFSSDDHPTHTKNTELNLSAVAPGRETTFTPNRTGDWHVHDHLHPEFTTTLLVTE